ncbi:MAG: hypothetical protein R3B09_25985 [Nannocystaceae bacterium]
MTAREPASSFTGGSSSWRWSTWTPAARPIILVALVVLAILLHARLDSRAQQRSTY